MKGWTWCGSCYVSALWVDERMRGHGVGTQLLQTAEQEARARGCQHMILDSYNFQAPGFYQKHGYEVFAMLEDHPRYHRNYYLRAPVLTPVTASNAGFAMGLGGTWPQPQPLRKPAPKAPQSPPPEMMRMSIWGGAGARPALCASYSPYDAR